MSKPILALNSIRGKSGKDTLIEHIEASGLKVHRVAFADTLKRECAQVLAGGPGRLAAMYESGMHRDIKDVRQANLSIYKLLDGPYYEWLRDRHNDPDEVSASRSLRWHLQQYGTEYIREHLGKPNHWLDQGILDVLNGDADPSVDVVVVTDLRLPNEYECLTEGGAKAMAYDRYEKDGEVIMLPLKVVDAKGKRIEKVPNISGGSEGKVRFSMFAYGWSNVAGASVKLQLDSFMLTKLVEFAAGGDDWGGQEEDGYVADDSDKGSAKSDWDEQEEESEGSDGDDGGDF